MSLMSRVLPPNRLSGTERFLNEYMGEFLCQDRQPVGFRGRAGAFSGPGGGGLQGVLDADDLGFQAEVGADRRGRAARDRFEPDLPRDNLPQGVREALGGPRSLEAVETMDSPFGVAAGPR